MTLAEIYRQCAADLAAVYAQASQDQVSGIIPACPGCTGQQLLSHLAGGSSDILADRMDDAPSPRWTGRHVGERASRTVAELTAELLGFRAAIRPLAGPLGAEGGVVFGSGGRRRG